MAVAVFVTSYNEWGEGTQIEPAVPHTADASKAMPEDIRSKLGVGVRTGAVFVARYLACVCSPSCPPIPIVVMHKVLWQLCHLGPGSGHPYERGPGLPHRPPPLAPPPMHHAAYL